MEIEAWPGGLRGPWLDSLSSKNSNEDFENYFDFLSRHAPTLRVAADDGKRLGVYAERLRVAVDSL